MKQKNVVQYQSSGHGSTNIQCLGDLTFGTLQVGGDSMTISMRKDQVETFTADELRAGVGWIAPKTKVKKAFGFKIGGGTEKEVDLDLVTVAEDEDFDPVRVCWYKNEDAFEDGNLTSDGDNTTGKGKGDDETHRAKLRKLPAYVTRLTFLVTAFKEGVSFQDIEGADLNIYDNETGAKLFSIPVKLNSRANAIAVATATRQADGSWSIRNLNEYGSISGTRDGLFDFVKQVNNR
ncbi:tellurium resistance protein D family [Streptomyces phage LuckySocke]|nr:tellurium resistance protein D family [Streptomyces phage LuckySocke]